MRQVYWSEDSDQFAASKTEGWSVLMDREAEAPLICWQPTSQGYPRPCLAGCVAMTEGSRSCIGDMYFHAVYCRAMPVDRGVLMAIGEIAEPIKKE